jgi:GT2 family glycosyltransferase
MKWPLVSIVLLNYNGRKFIELWSSLFKVEYPNYEIIFVDNGSSDKSDELFEEMLSKHLDRRVNVKIIKLKKNVGYSKANNIGVRKANGDYIVLLSNDIEVDKYWLKNMIEFLEKNDKVGVAQPLMFRYQNRKSYDITFGFIDVIGNIFSSLDVVPRDKINKPFEVFFCEGASMFIRRKALEEVGYLFDEDYFMYYEDVDFCWRVRKKGYKICVVPSSIVYHVRCGTVSGGRNPRYQVLFIRNKLRTLFRNYNTTSLIKYLPLAMIMELPECLIWIFSKKNYQIGLAVIKGVLNFLLRLPNEIEKKHAAKSILASTKENNQSEINNHILSLRKSLKIILRKQKLKLY